MSFSAVLEPSKLGSEVVASAARSAVPVVPPTTTMEVSFAQDGVPLRTVLVEQSAQLTEAATLELPAVNLPLVIDAPPAAQTISLEGYRGLVSKAQARAKRRRAAKKK
jgi:hypothetical protein